MGEISQLTNVCYNHFHGHPSRSLRDVFVDAVWDPNPVPAIPMFVHKNTTKNHGKKQLHIWKLTCWTRKWRSGRWFSFSIGGFLGSMLIFQGCMRLQQPSTMQFLLLHNFPIKTHSVIPLYGCFPKMVGFPPKSSILIGFSIVFTIHFGGKPPIVGNTQTLHQPKNHGALEDSKQVVQGVVRCDGLWKMPPNSPTPEKAVETSHWWNPAWMSQDASKWLLNGL